jgi:hypothetical protein
MAAQLALVVVAWCGFAGRALGQAAPARSQTAPVARTQSLAFEIKVATGLRSEPIQGRVYVFVGAPYEGDTLGNGPDWFRPEPFFAVNVQSWQPGDVLTIDRAADGFPGPLSELKKGRYAVRAVARVNLDTHRILDGDGNLFGPVVEADLDPANGGTVALRIDRATKPRTFHATDRIKLVELESPKLSAFYRRPIKHRAAVILPAGPSRATPDPKRPAVYIIPGFGGDHFTVERYTSGSRSYGTDFVRIVLDPDCGTGHHVFADSATNGPRGTALVEEFIPYLERTLPVIADPRARLLNGHSSGGWSSLWLQVTYPDFFGGTWSTSPDPVDFRDFQRINIYAPGENMFRDRAGKLRPIARMGSIPMLFYERFCRMDDVIDWGGQLGSFEAVFSPAGPGGRPRKLWDRKSGAIDPEVAKAWEAYDIRLVLERNWPVLGPKLKGKIHVFMGDMDSFYLEGATKLLKESLEKLKSDAVVVIVPNRDHRTLVDAALAKRLDREMHAAVGSW